MPYSQLAEELQSLTLEQSIRLWDGLEKMHGVEAVRQLCLADRYYLLVRMCKRHDALHPWLYARCREVEAAPDDRLDLWAREHYKSTIITFAGTVQEVLRDPDITIGIFSHTKPIAKKFFRQIKSEFERNEELKTAFSDILYANPQRESQRWSEENGIVIKRKGNQKEATVEAWGLVDGQPTSAHYQLRIYDDVVTRESVTTPEQVNKTTEAWELSDNLGMAGGRMWHIGTRYSFADTYHSILERKALTPRIYAATHNGQPEGDPVLLTYEQWEAKKIIQGPATIACQMLQNPIAGQQAMFNVEDVQYYEIRPGTLNVYILCDPARSMKKGSANTAFAVIGVDSGRNKYLLDGYNHRMDLKSRWDALSGLRKYWSNQLGVQNVWVGYEVYGALADMDYFKEQMEITGHSFPISELTWPRDGEGSKDDRVQRLGPDLRSHKLFLPKTVDGITSHQLKVMEDGQGYRVAKPIKRKDSENNIYDLSKQLIEQILFYPFAPLKDLIDATARIYDMEPRPPFIVNSEDLEPELFMDS